MPFVFRASWCFQVPGFFRSKSDIYKAKRKPKELKTVLFLGSPNPSSFFFLYHFKSSCVCFLYNVKGFFVCLFFLAFNGKNREKYVYFIFLQVENSTIYLYINLAFLYFV